jgi:hypothetical protein
MTERKSEKHEKPIPKSDTLTKPTPPETAVELSDEALEKAAGGALNAYRSAN